MNDESSNRQTATTQTARAGEGGGLPKGLSLFRFILFSCLMLGAIYGGASLYFSAPPPLGDRIESRAWQPSLIWLPTWITFKSSIGVIETMNGYAYNSQLGRAVNGSVTVIIGILLFGLIGWFGGEAIRRYAVRRRYA